MADILVTDAILSDMVTYVEGASKLIEKHASEQAELLRKAPSMVDVLIKQGFLHENERLAAIEACKSPIKLMESLQKTAELVAQRDNPPPAMGGTNSVKEAAVTVPSGQSPAMEDANRRFMSQFGF